MPPDRVIVPVPALRPFVPMVAVLVAKRNWLPFAPLVLVFSVGALRRTGLLIVPMPFGAVMLRMPVAVRSVPVVLASSSFPLVVRLIAAMVELTGALSVMSPLLASPMFNVPAVTRAISAADNSTVPGVVSTVEPRLMKVPFVRWRIVTAFVPALIEAGVADVSMRMELALIASVPVPPTPMSAPDCVKRSRPPDPPPLPVTTTLPPADVTVLPAAEVKNTPWEALPAPLFIPLTVTVLPAVPPLTSPPLMLTP